MQENRTMPRARRLGSVLPLGWVLAIGLGACGDSGGSRDVAVDTEVSETADTQPADTSADDGDGAGTMGLTLTSGAGVEAEIRGRYEDDLGGVLFEADPTATGATATLRTLDGTLLATVELVSADDALLRLPGEEAPLSGRGALTVSQRDALLALSHRPEAPALARAVMALGCVVSGEDTAAQRAALTFMWQLWIKVDGTFVPPHVLGASLSCRYFGEDRNVTAPSPGAPEGLILADDDRFPWVVGFLLVDAEGGASSPTLQAHAEAPCGAGCRGTCGPSCDPDACEVTTSGTCTQWSCGTHAGCREHDDCYDACNRAHGCHTVAAFVCRHASAVSCDLKCVAAHGTTCFSWAAGAGPFDGTLEYEHCGPDTPCEGLAYFTFEGDVLVDCGVAYSNCPGGHRYEVACSPPSGGVMACECRVDGERSGACTHRPAPTEDPIWCSGVSHEACCGFIP